MGQFALTNQTKPNENQKDSFTLAAYPWKSL
jgi:hypothetical protein